MHHHTELDGEHVSRYSAPLKKWNGLIYSLKICCFHFFTYLHKNYPNHVNGLHKTFSQRIQIKKTPLDTGQKMWNLHFTLKQNVDRLQTYFIYTLTFCTCTHFICTSTTKLNINITIMMGILHLPICPISVACHPHHTWQWETC